MRYLQALWDHISADPGALPVPESHPRLAEERLKCYREDPSRGHSAFDVLDPLTDDAKSEEAHSSSLAIGEEYQYAKH